MTRLTRRRSDGALPRRPAAGGAFALLVLALALAGCQSRPLATGEAPTAARLSPEDAPLTSQQTSALREQGFERTDEGWELVLASKVLFDFDSDTLDPDDLRAIERIGRALREAGIEKLRVEGHTDQTGNTAYNERLSLRRAQAVARALATVGLNAENISVRGFGPKRPVATNVSAAGRSENRRAAIVVPAQ